MQLRNRICQTPVVALRLRNGARGMAAGVSCTKERIENADWGFPSCRVPAFFENRPKVAPLPFLKAESASGPRWMDGMPLRARFAMTIQKSHWSVSPFLVANQTGLSYVACARSQTVHHAAFVTPPPPRAIPHCSSQSLTRRLDELHSASMERVYRAGISEAELHSERAEEYGTTDPGDHAVDNASSA